MVVEVVFGWLHSVPRRSQGRSAARRTHLFVSLLARHRRRVYCFEFVRQALDEEPLLSS